MDYFAKANAAASSANDFVIGQVDPLRIRTALTDLLYRQAPAVFAGNIFVASLFVYILFDDAPDNLLIEWASAIFILTGVRTAVIVLRKQRPALLTDHHWANLFAALAALSGILWGSLSPLFFTPENAKAVLLIGIVLAGMVGGSVASLSSYLPAYWGYAIPTVLPFILRSLQIGGPLFNVFAMLATFLLGVNLYYSRVIHRTLSESVRLRFENLLLVEQLTAERDRATAANGAKTRFLAAASHDLRQPTHAVSLFAATLASLSSRSSEVASGVVANIASKIEQALKGLRTLLDTLLDISRLDAGVVEANPRPTDLTEVLHLVAHDFAEEAERRGLALRVRARPAWGVTDPMLLRQIVSNLVSNAIKYSTQGGVLIGLRPKEGHWCIDVSDTGIGIAEAHQSVVFEEFQQLQNPERDRAKGFGLGLAIVRRLADLLGHGISLRSQLNRGSRFRVEIQACATPPLENAIQRTTEPAAAPYRRACILLIDDDQAIQNAAYSLFPLWGYDIVVIGDPADFCPLPDLHIDLIISDYRLRADLTGTEAIQRVCAVLKRTPPAILVTGDTSPERTREAGEAGYPILHKPLDAEALQQTIADALHTSISATERETAVGAVPGHP